MRKIGVVLLCLFLAALVAAPMAASASEGSDGLKVIGDAWDWGERVPDYVSGFWLNGNDILTVGLVDDSRREEVLDMIGDTQVEFVDQVYTYNELKDVMTELSSCFDLSVGLMTIGIDMRKNAVEVGVDTEKEDAATFIKVTAALYGEKVFFRDLVGRIIVPGEIPDKRPDGREASFFQWRIVLGMICATGIVAVAIQRIYSKTGRGKRAKGNRKNFSRRDVEKLVRQYVESPLVSLSDFSE